MIVLAVILAAVAAYLWYGFAIVAPTYVTRSMERYAEEYPSLAANPGYVAERRRNAAGEAVPMALVWPAYLTVRALADGIARRATLSGPERLRAEDRERHPRRP